VSARSHSTLAVGLDFRCEAVALIRTSFPLSTAKLFFGSGEVRIDVAER
jgi:hypothetical protein